MNKKKQVGLLALVIAMVTVAFIAPVSQDNELFSSNQVYASQRSDLGRVYTTGLGPMMPAVWETQTKGSGIFTTTPDGKHSVQIYFLSSSTIEVNIGGNTNTTNVSGGGRRVQVNSPSGDGYYTVMFSIAHPTYTGEVPAPEPEPEPTPEPAPAPTPAPKPEPKPEPKPAPKPAPAPAQKPAPSPTPPKNNNSGNAGSSSNSQSNSNSSGNTGSSPSVNTPNSSQSSSNSSQSTSESTQVATEETSETEQIDNGMEETEETTEDIEETEEIEETKAVSNAPRTTAYPLRDFEVTNWKERQNDSESDVTVQSEKVEKDNNSTIAIVVLAVVLVGGGTLLALQRKTQK